MEYPDFSFYNSENDGYRGGFGDYTDPIPTSGGPAHPSEPPKKKGRGKRIAALLLACAVVGGGAGVGGAAVYQNLTAPDTVIYEGERPQVDTMVNTNSGHSFSNGDKYTAKLVGGEKDNDLAVLKIEAAGLQPVTLGDSDQLVVGESVYAIGNPLGELTYTLTDGIVSALDRLITTSSKNANGQTETTTLNVLQTNCAINPGNSGGPLFDSYGNVVGIVSAKYTESTSGVSAEGLGFALPINDVKEIISDLIEHGYVTGKPYLGVQVNVVDESVQRYGIPAGAVVEYVAEGSCAQKAGLQVNDIITAIDDTAVDSPSALTAALSSDYKAGDTATLTVVRQQQEVKLTVTFDEKNAETEAANQNQQNTQQGQQQNPNGGYYYQWPFGSFGW